MYLNEYTLADLTPGLSEKVQREIYPNDIETFSAYSGDFSPIHFDDEYARGRGFKQRLVHGVFVGSVISGFIGMCLPGKHGLLQALHMDFRNPCYAPNTLRISGSVQRRSEATKTVVIDLQVTDDRNTHIVSAVAKSVLKH